MSMIDMKNAQKWPKEALFQIIRGIADDSTCKPPTLKAARSNRVRHAIKTTLRWFFCGLESVADQAQHL